jgi:hypothetical protein
MKKLLFSTLLACVAAHTAAAEPLTFQNGSAYFGATHAVAGVVVDDWTFSVPSTSLANASLVSAALGPVGTHWFQITNAEILGDGIAVAFESALMPQNGRWQAWFLPDSTLPSGDYTLRVTGNVYRGYGAGSYAGTINVSPVPEPSALALAAAGLFAVMWVVRRKTAKESV